MSFFSEVAKRAGLSELSLAGGYHVVNYNGEAVYIEGVERLNLLDESEIRLFLRGAELAVKGEGLYIHELGGGVIIKGEVVSMEFLRRARK